MKNEFFVSDELRDEIAKYFELHTAGTLCIFDYSDSLQKSSGIAKKLASYIERILQDNDDYKVASTTCDEFLDLIFVVFDIKG